MPGGSASDSYEREREPEVGRRGRGGIEAREGETDRGAGISIVMVDYVSS